MNYHRALIGRDVEEGGTARVEDGDRTSEAAVDGGVGLAGGVSSEVD